MRIVRVARTARMAALTARLVEWTVMTVGRGRTAA